MDPSPAPLAATAPSPRRRGCFDAVVTANVSPCDEHFRLTLKLSAFPPTAPGQFVQLLCRADDEQTLERAIDWPTDHPRSNDPQAFLRRPFSLADRRDVSDSSVELDIIHRVIGVGTAWLGALPIGATVSVLGPLGNRFTPPVPACPLQWGTGSPIPVEPEKPPLTTPPSDPRAPSPDTQLATDNSQLSPPSPHARVSLLVGGGVGIPPMLYLASAWAGQPMVAFAGALRHTLLPLDITAPEKLSRDGSHAALAATEFTRHGVPIVISTDDGSLGRRGFVTDALEAFLDANALIDPVIYTCGPEPMLKRVAAIAQKRNLECQVAVERAMACGMGTCQSCCIRIRKPDPSAVPLPGSPWAWRLACTDGPVFQAADILW